MCNNRNPRRMWVNQPSSHQPHHAHHGTRVLALAEDPTTMRVYFLEGPVISMQMGRESLSEGWPSSTNSPATVP